MGVTLRDQNYLSEDIKRRMCSGTTCYRWV